MYVIWAFFEQLKLATKFFISDSNLRMTQYQRDSSSDGIWPLTLRNTIYERHI